MNVLYSINSIIARRRYVFRYRIKITFDNGEQNLADFSKWLEGEVFEFLKDKTYFLEIFVDGQAIACSDGAHLAPETLYLESERDLSCNRP